MASLGPPTSNLVAGVDDDDDLCVKQAILGLDFELDSLTPGRSPGCQLRSSGSHPDRIPGFHQSTYFGTCQSPESAVKPSQAKPSQPKTSLPPLMHPRTHACTHASNREPSLGAACAATSRSLCLPVICAFALRAPARASRPPATQAAAIERGDRRPTALGTLGSPYPRRTGQLCAGSLSPLRHKASSPSEAGAIFSATSSSIFETRALP